MELKTFLGVGKKTGGRIFNKLIIKPSLLESLEHVLMKSKIIIINVQFVQH
ncbi:MAG: hypothetical protein OHM56_10135 [Spiroplasma phoeniceum]|nr:MAG: hypothetical protein OHM57_09545 [Spiroplasma phoeniceum]UZQ31932.1 MAG: hypothetical protein OHM56_10135 [Spiroplasma phoeniceum]